jgi:tetratricopeptide (TPR) repeat protein
MKKENKKITIDEIIGEALATIVLKMCSPKEIQAIQEYYGFKQEKEEFEREYFYLMMFLSTLACRIVFKENERLTEDILAVFHNYVMKKRFNLLPASLRLQAVEIQLQIRYQQYQELLKTKQSDFDLKFFLEQVQYDFLANVLGKDVHYVFSNEEVTQLYGTQIVVFGLTIEQLFITLTDFLREFKEDSNYASAWYNKGVALVDLGKYEEALVYFDKAIELNPNDAEVWDNKGIVLGYLGKHEEALVCFNKALEQNPNNADAWYNKGVALYDLGKIQEAISCYNEAIEIKPNNADVWHMKGLALVNLSNYEEAIDCFNKALKLNPNFVNTWYVKGLALGKLGKYEEALDCYNKANEIRMKES